MFNKKIMAATCAVSVMVLSQAAMADDYTLTLKNNTFAPQKLTVPAHQKFTLMVDNQDSAPAEFESSDLHREKVVGANSKIQVKLGPLEPGTYGFFDDFHHDTTTGTLIAK